MSWGLEVENRIRFWDSTRQLKSEDLQILHAVFC